MTLRLSLLLLALHAAAQSNTPPSNDSATDPWWPQYPDGRGIEDYMMNESASDADLRGETDIAKWLIEASNMFRAQFKSGPVTWNETSARVAQDHTNTCLWEHWGNDNLAEQSGSEPSMRFDVRSMTEMWAVEWDYYPFSNPERQEYSHFTAMTWNASTTVGCGWNINCSNNSAWPSKTYFVCNYWPPGNILTSPPGIQFALNVQNFTGWPVDAAKASSIASLTSEARPTSGMGGDGGSRGRPSLTTTASGSAQTGSAGGNAAFSVTPAMTLLGSTVALALGAALF